MFALDPFIVAQEAAHAGFDDAMAELRAGRKSGHWIWYVFPQLAGLGQSEMSRRFGLRDLADAEAYVRHQVLGARLIEAVDTVWAQVRRVPPPPLHVLMGSRIDALKLVSSLTLFEGVALRLAAGESNDDVAQLAERAGEVLAIAAAQGYPRCALTAATLSRRP